MKILLNKHLFDNNFSQMNNEHMENKECIKGEINHERNVMQKCQAISDKKANDSVTLNMLNVSTYLCLAPKKKSFKNNELGSFVFKQA